MVEPVVDSKAGFCSNCRRGDHALCGSASCTCPDMRKHRNRPGFAGRDDTVAQPPIRNVPQAPPVRTVKQDEDDEPVWCDPPASLRGGQRRDWVALTAPCKDRPGQWLRVKKWPAKSSANSQAPIARKTLGAGWEVRSAKLDDGSALWVRWNGGGSDGSEA